MIPEVKEGYWNRVKNKLFGLLCEREKNGEWDKFLDNIIIELEGIPEDGRGINYYVLIYKLNSLRYLSYKYFRTTIFDCMTIIESFGGGRNA